MEKVTLEEVAQIIDSEGIGYAITGYLTYDKIADPRLAELWLQAQQVLAEIEEMLPELPWD